jgi:hypothetical protein
MLVQCALGATGGLAGQAPTDEASEHRCTAAGEASGKPPTDCFGSIPADMSPMGQSRRIEPPPEISGLPLHSRHVGEQWTSPLWADAVEKVKNRTTPKISQIVNFELPRRCDAL